MKATCSVDDCDRPTHSRGWCQTHYRRWRETGNPGSAEIEPRRPGRVCAMDGCDRPTRCLDWCRKHYDRWRSHGDPGFQWRLDVVDYAGAHVRIRKVRGLARDLRCVECGNTAAEWAYDNADPNELRGDNHGIECAYSLDPDHYVPMCKSCHKSFDVKHAMATGVWVGRGPAKQPQTHCPRGHEFTPENTYRRPDNTDRRQCRTCIKRRERARTVASRKPKQR